MNDTDTYLLPFGSTQFLRVDQRFRLFPTELLETVRSSLSSTATRGTSHPPRSARPPPLPLLPAAPRPCVDIPIGPPSRRNENVRERRNGARERGDETVELEAPCAVIEGGAERVAEVDFAVDDDADVRQVWEGF